MQTIPLTDVKVKQQFSYSNDSTAKNQEIHQYFVTRNYKACMSTIEQQLKKYDNNSEYALYVKGLILRQQGKVQESLTVFQTVADLNPVSIDNIKQVAKTYMLLGRYKEAVDNFDEALSLTQDPDWECLHNKAMCLQQLGNDEQAIETYLQAIEADPQQVTLCALGNIYSQLERYSEALPMYEHALTLSPENSELLTIVGLICLRMGDHDKAFEKLGSALTIDPRNSKTILAAGMIIQDKGDTDVALAKYRIAAAHSEFAELWNNIGMCFYSKQKIQAAISCLLKARSMAQFDWRIAYNLGILYLETEQVLSGYLSLSASIFLNRMHAPSYMHLGIALSKLGDIDNAVDAYHKSIALQNNPITHLNMAISLLNHDRIEQCKQALRSFASSFNAMSEDEKREGKTMRETSEKLVMKMKERERELAKDEGRRRKAEDASEQQKENVRKRVSDISDEMNRENEREESEREKREKMKEILENKKREQDEELRRLELREKEMEEEMEKERNYIEERMNETMEETEEALGAVNDFLSATKDSQESHDQTDNEALHDDSSELTEEERLILQEISKEDEGEESNNASSGVDEGNAIEEEERFQEQQEDEGESNNNEEMDDGAQEMDNEEEEEEEGNYGTGYESAEDEGVGEGEGEEGGEGEGEGEGGEGEGDDNEEGTLEQDGVEGEGNDEDGDEDAENVEEEYGEEEGNRFDEEEDEAQDFQSYDEETGENENEYSEGDYSS